MPKLAKPKRFHLQYTKGPYNKLSIKDEIALARICEEKSKIDSTNQAEHEKMKEVILGKFKILFN